MMFAAVGCLLLIFEEMQGGRDGGSCLGSVVARSKLSYLIMLSCSCRPALFAICVIFPMREKMRCTNNY